MRARDLMEDYPAVDVSTDASEAARRMVADQRPALLVFEHGRPKTILPAAEVLGHLIPAYIRDDPSLARVMDEQGSDSCVARLEGRTVRNLLGERLTGLPSVEPNDTVLECAAVMARTHSPLCVVVDAHHDLLGAVTAARVIAALLS